MLERLLGQDRDSISIYHSFKPAMRAAGDDILRAIKVAMEAEIDDADAVTEMSSLMTNLDTGSISPNLALGIARDERLPRQARLRAYRLAGPPLELAGETLAIEAFEQPDWDSNYAARDLIHVHPDPARFVEGLLRAASIPVSRRVDIAASISRHVDRAEGRAALARRLIEDGTVDAEIRTALRLMEARYGDVDQFRALVDDIPSLPEEHVATTIALFGHHPDRVLAERAASLTRIRAKTAGEIARVAQSVTTGMRHVFEMDWGFGGVVRPAPPHAGIAPWIELVEDWSDRDDLTPQDRMRVRTAAAGIGSESIAAKLERDLQAIEDFDDDVWKEDDKLGNVLSSALHQIRRRLPASSDEFIQRLLDSSRYNVATYGIGALADRSDQTSLRRLLQFHNSQPDWHLRDTAANRIEQLAARLQIVVRKQGSNYEVN